MKALNLRSRLLIGFGLIAALQAVVAVTVINVAHERLVEQVDERLRVAASPNRGERFAHEEEFELRELPDEITSHSKPLEPPERLSDTYEGMLAASGSLTTFFAPNSTGDELPPPDVDLARARRSQGRPFTASATNGEVDYRVIATDQVDGAFRIAAVPIDGVQSTTRQISWVVAVTAGTILLALALVTWWVLRLGIRPIKQMTATAKAIADGDLSERIACADDRTEAGQLGQALNTMLGRIESSFEQQQRAEDQLRQFVADASHELRTPVATIRGYAELYRSGGLDDPSALEDAMRRTEQESQRLSRLIADMLNLAKLDRSPTVPTRPVSLGALIRDAVTDARATHSSRTIQFDLGNDALTIVGDEDLLRQLLANVVTNAVVHTSTDVVVTIAAELFDGNAVITVNDCGDGMAPEVVARVTERFFRGDPSRSRHRGGSGLGLAIAERIVSAHHGTLKIDSVLGVGTTVTITLPASPAMA